MMAEGREGYVATYMMAEVGEVKEVRVCECVGRDVGAREDLGGIDERQVTTQSQWWKNGAATT